MPKPYRLEREVIYIVNRVGVLRGKCERPADRREQVRHSCDMEQYKVVGNALCLLVGRGIILTGRDGVEETGFAVRRRQKVFDDANCGGHRNDFGTGLVGHHATRMHEHFCAIEDIE